MTVKAIICSGPRQRRGARRAWRRTVMRVIPEGDAAAIALAWAIVSEMPVHSDALDIPSAWLAVFAFLSPADADAAMARLEQAGLVIRTPTGIHLAHRTTEDRA